MNFFKKLLSFFKNKQQIPDGYDAVEIKEMKFKKGKMTLALAHPQLVVFAESVVKFFNDTKGINYVTNSFWHPEEGFMELIVRKKDRKSPTELHQELLMAVERKFPGETRHETALRYIREAETLDTDVGWAKQQD